MQALCSKLKTHWTNIAHHLYLKSDAPVPLPAVGPLAELLNVTRGVCQDVLALAAANRLSPADISAALDASTVALLGKLVHWLQADPNEQLLLNTERSESLWQLLLLTLANMLRALQPENLEAVDADLINRFKQQLLSSGRVVQGTVIESSSKDPYLDTSLYSGLLQALKWVLKHAQQRCLTSTMGAWLLLQELFATESSAEQSDASASPAATEAASTRCQPHCNLPNDVMEALGQLLQGYVDQAYSTVAQADMLASQTPSSNSSTGSSSVWHSSTGTLQSARMGANMEKTECTVRASSPCGPRKRGAAAPSVDAGTASSTDAALLLPADGKLASESDDKTVLQGYSHAVCLTDEPGAAVFKQMLVWLHSMQIQLVVLAASSSSSNGSEEGLQDVGRIIDSHGRFKLPHTMHLHVLALINTWLAQYVRSNANQSAETDSTSQGQHHNQQTFTLPLEDVALSAVVEATMGELHAVQHLMKLCASSLEDDCIRYKWYLQKQQQPGNAAGAIAGSDAGASVSTSEGGVDFSAVFRVLLYSASLQLAAGAVSGVGETLHALAVSSGCCTRSEVLLLLKQQGSHLLAVLQGFITQEPPTSDQQQHKEQHESVQPAGNGPTDAVQAAAAASASDLVAERLQHDRALRCVVCAKVFIDICRTGRSSHGIDDVLLGSLTETDPATFYSIMDTLVRNVHPESLTVLLPLSACFLHHDMTAVMELRKQQEQSAVQADDGLPPVPATSNGAGSSSSSNSNGNAGIDYRQLIASSRSMVILYDADVCRTFAAALHGYSKTVLTHLQDSETSGGCSEACGHDHGHDHSHHHQVLVGAMLSPLQQVAVWLLFSADVTLSAAQETSIVQERKAKDAAAPDFSSSSSSSEEFLASVHQQAKQLQDISHGAAGSLVLTILLARAAVPVLSWMQAELKQLPSAGGGSSSNGSDVLLQPLTVSNLLSALHFVRNVWQAVCARYALSQCLEEQLHELLQAAAKAAQRATALVQQREAGGASSDIEAAIAEAERVAQGVRASASATNAALHGKGMMRGWIHLAYLLPQMALQHAKVFQETWPGDLFNSCHAASFLDTAQQQLRSKQESSTDSMQHVPLAFSAGLQRELLQLVADAWGMLIGFIDAVPLPVGCNNPLCSRVEAVAEATLSINKRCSQCLSAHYCCRDCQVSHWPSHKLACKRLRQQMPGKQPALV